MSNARRQTAVGRGFLNLGAGEVVARLIAFAVTVYLARHLTASAYGTIVLAAAILLYVGRVTDCGVDLLGVSDVAQDPSALPRLLPQFLSARLLAASVASLILVLAGLTVRAQPDGVVLALYGLTLLPIALAARWAQIGLERSGVASSARVATEALSAVVVLLLVHDAGDVAHVPLAIIISEALGAFLLLRGLPAQQIRVGELLRLDVGFSLYRRSWSLVVYSLLGLVIFNSDFFFLRIYRDSAIVGYYAAATALVSFFINVGITYSQSFLPVIARLRGDAEGERTLYHTAIAQLFTGAVPIAVGGCLVADRLIPAIFGQSFEPAVLPLRILIWSIPLSAIRGVAQSVMVAHERQRQLVQTVTWSAGFNIGLNLFLIPTWGMIGAAAATTITNVIRAALMFALIHREGLPMASAKRFWRSVMACLVMVCVLWAFETQSVWLAIATGATAYLIVLSLVGGVRFHRRALPEFTV